MNIGDTMINLDPLIAVVLMGPQNNGGYVALVIVRSQVDVIIVNGKFSMPVSKTDEIIDRT
jgi:hypothetical protein